MRRNVLSRRRGFTLVEILIVVVLLAIIAGLVVPAFMSVFEGSREATLLGDIQTIRKQVELYRLEHNGLAPHLDPDGVSIRLPQYLILHMTQRSTSSGAVDPEGPYGPYLDEWPANPFSNDSVARLILLGTSTKPPRNGITGWYYNTDTCIVSANSTTGGETLDPE